ncbi:MAG: FAD-dependent oxidoreductase [Myxococcota bacterium]|nr:FAD-dependent oxidoreductase [Myxococcota bacterium]
MRALQRLIRDHQLAEREGVPPEVIAQRRREAQEHRRREGRGPTRRQFLAGAAAGAAAISAPSLVRGRGTPRIVIVGGGLAGLTAALTLRDAGVPCTVYEAQQRVGGRMLSNTGGYWAGGQVTEWMGELIDSGHETIQALVQRFGLTLESVREAEPPGSEEVYHFNGSYYDREQADRDFRPVMRALRIDNRAAGYPTTYNRSTPAGRALDNMSVFDWIEWRIPGGHDAPLGMLFDVAYNIEFAAETTEQSALNLVYLAGSQPDPQELSLFGESDEAFHIRGGNQQLPQAIAQYLGMDAVVRLGYRMESLVCNSGGSYTLTFSRAGGGVHTVVADIVVLTLPFAVLARLDIRRAGFDARKRRAIYELGRGHSGKLQLQFQRRAWNGRGPWPGLGNGSTFADTGYQSTWEPTRGQAGTEGVLTNFTGGFVTDALRTRHPFGTSANPSVRRDAQDFLARIEPVIPGLARLWNGKATLSIPHLDPHFGLSYSYYRVGQYQDLAGYERVRQGNVFFAGEHTSLDFQGYMEGAASEGVRVGQEVLAALGPR